MCKACKSTDICTFSVVRCFPYDVRHLALVDPKDIEFEAKNYGGPQLSHRNQMLTANYKSLTSNSNRSQQIQISHSELQITQSKLQIAHSKFKWPTANSNRLQQIKVAHSKFKLFTTNYKLLTPVGVFGYLKPAVQVVSKYLSYMKPLLDL